MNEAISPHLFDGLFVSTPNDAGLFAIHKSTVIPLDMTPSTGMDYSMGKLYRGVQDGRILIYGEGIDEINATAIGIKDVHDIKIIHEKLWAVSTDTNEIIQMEPDGSVLKKYRFSNEPDSWHINCVSLINDEIVFTAFGEFTSHRGYKGHTAGAGFAQSLRSSKKLIDGLSQPHGVFPSGSRTIVVNSEKKELLVYENNTPTRIITLNGYPRGICASQSALYVGLSCSRNIVQTNDGAPSAQVVALDISNLGEMGRLAIPAKEIYDIVYIDDHKEFSTLVERISLHHQLRDKSNLVHMRGIIEERDELLSLRTKQMMEREKLIEERDNLLHLRTAQLNELEQRILEKTTQLTETQERCIHQASTIQAQEHHINEQAERLSTLSGELSAALNRITIVEAEIARRSQISWWVMLPLRRAWKLANSLLKGTHDGRD